jgi:aspartate aminotransferase-like enzyme
MPTAPPTGWKLFIPGPTHVRPAIREAMALPMISHRGEEMKQLLADLLPAVREAFGTRGDVVVLSCSSSAALEAASRGAVRPGRRVLHLTNGNFSRQWWEEAVACGQDAVNAELPWGQAWDEERTAKKLKDVGAVDAVMVTHCETSTGALADVAGVVRAVRAAQPEALVGSDVTSTAAGVPVDFDRVGLDLAIGGVQKCWAVPPALALAALSPRAKARMAAHAGRGWTNDFLSALQFQDDQKMTNVTPAIPQMQALRRQIRDIEAADGMAARFRTHDAMQKLVLDWAAARGLGILAPAGFRSPSVTSIACEGRFAIAELIAGLMHAGYFIQPGYGKTAVTHWRIGHMGDHTPKCVQELLDVTDGVLKRIGADVAARR